MSLIPPRSLSEGDEKRILEELLNPQPFPKPEEQALQLVSYEDVVFEPKALYAGNDKALLTFNQSLDALQQRGFQRHARPAEAFGLLRASLEGKLTAPQQTIAQDMLSSYGEWLSAATETQTSGWFWKKTKLFVYFDPLVYWNGIAYVWQANPPTFAEKYEFDITGIPLSEWVDLNRFPAAFVELMYGCSFAALSPKMQTGDKRAQVWLRSELGPVGRSNFNIRYDIYSYYNLRASRGVAPKR